MRKVGIRELNQRTAEVIARVEMGERVEITRNGTTVGIIEPTHLSPLAALLETGELRPARSLLPTFNSTGEMALDSRGLDAVVADRENPDRW
jgi:antitoxin (DNA-binding transcriptional repressor) of toxin-antitoxin stability system